MRQSSNRHRIFPKHGQLYRRHGAICCSKWNIYYRRNRRHPPPKRRLYPRVWSDSVENYGYLAPTFGVWTTDSKGRGDFQAGWLGEISTEVPGLEVPAGEYKIRMGKQFIERITNGTGEKLVLE